MALNIIKASEPIPIETLIILCYGDPGSGKTSLAQTASNPMTLDFAGTGGVHRSGFRRDTARIDDWSDVASMDEKDLAPYDTLVVDTVGGCLDVMSLDIIRQNPKMATSAGALTLQGYGALKAGFSAWMRKLRSFGLDVVLIAHGTEKESGDTLILRPEIIGASYGTVFKDADGVAYLRMEGKKRVLQWDPQERSVGKNPAGLPKTEVPHLAQDPHFLADLIAKTKEFMGQLSEEGKRTMETVADWQKDIQSADTAESLTALVLAANDQLTGSPQKQVKALLAERARELEFTWDKGKKAFLRKAS